MERQLSRKRGFTLIEMIAVLAIMAVLSSIIVPNALRALDRAVVEAERATLGNFADSLRQYTIDTGTLPSVATWASSIAEYADVNVAAVSSNRRNQIRVYLRDPSTSPAERAMLLSSMRVGLGLPSASSINTQAEFDDLWETAEDELPSATSWSGWANWRTVDDSESYFIIQRINLKPIYRNELKTSDVVINNTSAQTTSYKLLDKTGAVAASANLAPSTTVALNNLRKGERVDIFEKAGGSTLLYTHVVGPDDISFDLSNWIGP